MWAKSRHAAICVGLAMVVPTVGTVNAAARPAERGDDNLDIAILVDESRSLSTKDVAAERTAVTQIVNIPMLFDRNIRVSIAPFSSGYGSPRKLDGCESVPLTRDTSTILSECANQIVRQTDKSSSNTDFATAISETTKKLGSPEDAGRLHAIILLTDGQYDPDGNESVSPAEKQALDAALDGAQQGMVSIWALGFGKANLDALRGYSAAGAQVPSQCVSSPKSSTVSVSELVEQMQQLVASLTCTDPPHFETTPIDLMVSPLLSDISLSVTTQSRNNPVVTDGAGHDPCRDMWTKQGSTYDCYLSLDGTNSGKWTIRTDQKGYLAYQFRGELAGSIDSCDADPVLHVERMDGKSIDWEASSEWPVLNGFFVDSAGQTLAPPVTLPVDRADIPVDVPIAIRDKAARLEFELPRDSKDSLVYSLSRISCDLQTVGVTSSTAAAGGVTSISPTTVATEPASIVHDDGGIPAVIWVLGIVLLVGAGYLTYRLRRNRLFPDGTLVMQESLDKPGTFVELDGEVAGKRRVSLRKSGGRFLSLEPYGDAADITLSRSGLEVQVEYPTGEISEDGEAVVERTTAPFGIAIKVQGFVIRVDIPEGIDDEF